MIEALRGMLGRQCYTSSSQGGGRVIKQSACVKFGGEMGAKRVV